MASPTYAIRLATSADLPYLPAIEQAAAQRFRTTPYADLAAAAGMSAADFAHYWATGWIWVASAEGDTPVGFAVTKELDGNLYLHELDVLPAHSGQRLGARLIEAVVAWAKSNGYPAITLSTFSDVAWNAPYYQRLGFRLLAPEELTPGLQAVRQEEAAAGLAIERRVCMLLSISE